MEYRKACTGDIPILTEFRKKLLLEEEAQPDINIDSELYDYFSLSLADGSLIAWLAVDGHEIIAAGGVCFYKLPPTFLNPSCLNAYITNMYTLREYRRRGIAAHILELLVGEAKGIGCKVVRLHASKDGRSVYQRAGFSDSDGYMRMSL